MNGKLLIPACLFIVMQFFYDLFGVAFTTKWSIYYYCSMYLSWLVLMILLSNRKKIKRSIPYLVLGAGFVIYIIMELSCWNMSWDEYYKNINEFKKYILPIATIITGLTYYILKK